MDMDNMDEVNLREHLRAELASFRYEIWNTEVEKRPQLLIRIHNVWRKAVKMLGHSELCVEFDLLIVKMESELSDINVRYRAYKLDQNDTKKVKFLVNILDFVASFSEAWREKWSEVLRRRREGTLAVLVKHWKGHDIPVCQWIEKQRQGMLNLPLLAWDLGQEIELDSDKSPPMSDHVFSDVEGQDLLRFSGDSEGSLPASDHAGESEGSLAVSDHVGESEGD